MDRILSILRENPKESEKSVHLNIKYFNTRYHCVAALERGT